MRATDTSQPETIERDPQAATEERPLTTADISEGRRTDIDEQQPVAERTPMNQSQETDAKRIAPLFTEDAATELRDRWTEVQTGFVDEPRKAVEQADALVAEVMKRLAESFATERQALEQQWSKGDDVSTEELRISLRRYRSFFDRLLSV
jgi:hypothetical protein